MKKANETTGVPYVKLAIAAAGGVAIWMNRTRIMRFFESSGISDALASGQAKVVDSFQNGVAALTHSAEDVAPLAKAATKSRSKSKSSHAHAH